MKILIYIPVYKRREITRCCYDSLKRAILHAPKGFSFITVIVASNNEDAALAQEYGFDVVWSENKPLGRKFNTGLEYALESYNWDYLMQLNSDDVLAGDFWQLFQEYFNRRMYFFGVDRVYFYDSDTKDMREFSYTLGCGIRFIRRDIVEKAGYIERNGEEVFELWEPGKNAGLDNNSSDNILARAGKMQYIARARNVPRPVVVDIKSTVNIHPFSEFKGAKRLSESHRKQVMRRFPELKAYDERMRRPVRVSVEMT